MKVLIVGSGAVGCILGASMIRSGHDVTFLARGGTLEALRKNGLRIEWPSETWTLEKVRAIDGESASEPFDHLLFCVKGYDCQTAATILPRFPSRFILTFQNGVQIHHELRKQLQTIVLGSVIYVSADRAEPGVIKSKSTSRVVLDGSPKFREEMAAIKEALANSCLTVSLSEDIETDLWRKYLFLCTFSALNTLTEKSLAPILQEPRTEDLCRQMMKEMIRVAHAEGVQLNEQEVNGVMENAGRFPPNTSSSLFSDYQRRQQTEVDLLHGHLVRLAEKHGVDVPVSRTIYALLKLKTREDE